MGFKTISISEDVYDLLSMLKRKGESFTDLLRRLGTESKESGSLDEFFGMWAGPEFDDVEKRIAEARARDRKADRARMKRLGLE
jgi:predicted CopG family antitoxin